MTWLRVDDKFPRHPKVSALTDREFRVHVRLLCWCSEYKTEGNIPDGAFNDVAGLTRAMGRRFFEVGLWDERDGMMVIHDFEDYRPKDATNADRQRAWRERNGKRNAPHNGSVTPEVTEGETPDVTDPYTRAPVPVPALLSEEISTANAVSPAERLFALWKDTWGHKRSVLTPPRRKLVERRLKDGYTEETLADAIRGSKVDAVRWPERNQTSAHTFELILRDAAHIDVFLAALAPTNGNNPTDARDAERRAHTERIEAMRREKGWI